MLHVCHNLNIIPTPILIVIPLNPKAPKRSLREPIDSKYYWLIKKHIKEREKKQRWKKKLNY
jgi:hypothetical protein